MFREGAAVDRNEITWAAVADPMNEPGADLLARASLSTDEHRVVADRDVWKLANCGQEGVALADQRRGGFFSRREFPTEPRLQAVSERFAAAGLIEQLLQAQMYLDRVERRSDEIIRALFDRFHQFLARVSVGYWNDRRPG